MRSFLTIEQMEINLRREGNQMNANEMINTLVQDYEDYLSDLNTEQLNLIIDNGVFTLKQAKRVVEMLEKENKKSCE